MKNRSLVSTVLKAVALALSVAVVVLIILGTGTVSTYITLMALGLFALSLVTLTGR